MHTHDHTLLAKFGWKDPDKRHPLHDQICEYLVINAQQIFEKYGSPKRLQVATPTVIRAELEHIISKGDGKYRTHVGFIDAWITVNWEYHDGKGNEETYTAFEVKTTRTSISEILRQVKLYRQHKNWRFAQWIVVTTWSVSEDEKRLLQAEEIYHKRAEDLGFLPATPNYDKDSTLTPFLDTRVTP